MATRVGTASVEWPTLGLIAATYGAWALGVLYYAQLSSWIAVPMLALALVLHSSLQHETVHGHPLPSRRTSEALVFPALGLFIPYGRFRDLHLIHHKDARLTDPYDDPESAYFAPEMYARLPAWARAMLVVNNTLLGRIVIGPLVGLEAFYRTEARLLAAGSPTVWRDWALHGAGLIPVVALLWMGSCPWWAYLLAAYLAQSILKIRTFLEHQAHEKVSARSVIIEDRGPLAFLFLNNNLHAVHHANPTVAWYDLPGLYRARRADFLARNRGYAYPSYRAVMRAHLVHAKEPVVHPIDRG